MVKRLLVVFALLSAMNVNAITPDALREMSANSARDQQARDARLKSDQLDKLVPVSATAPVDDAAKIDPAADDKAKKEPTAARVNKYDNTVPAANTKARTVGAASSGESAPTANATSAAPSGFADAVKIDRAHQFGISLGTWLEGRVNRDTTSAEPGLVDITVARDYVGAKKTLPQGTLLFARKQLNRATRRMELYVVRGITPARLEFAMTGLIFDMSKVSGLSGIITGDTEASIKRGASKGALAAVGAAASALQGPLARAGGAAVGSVASDTERVVDETTEQQLTAYVAAQPVLIRIEESF